MIVCVRLSSKTEFCKDDIHGWKQEIIWNEKTSNQKCLHTLRSLSALSTSLRMFSLAFTKSLNKICLLARGVVGSNSDSKFSCQVRVPEAAASSSLSNKSFSSKDSAKAENAASVSSCVVLNLRKERECPVVGAKALHWLPDAMRRRNTVLALNDNFIMLLFS